VPRGNLSIVGGESFKDRLHVVADL
jgi:hypothetical protein